MSRKRRGGTCTGSRLLLTARGGHGPRDLPGRSATSCDCPLEALGPAVLARSVGSGEKRGRAGEGTRARKRLVLQKPRPPCSRSRCQVRSPDTGASTPVAAGARPVMRVVELRRCPGTGSRPTRRRPRCDASAATRRVSLGEPEERRAVVASHARARTARRACSRRRAGSSARLRSAPRGPAKIDSRGKPKDQSGEDDLLRDAVPPRRRQCAAPRVGRRLRRAHPRARVVIELVPTSTARPRCRPGCRGRSGSKKRSCCWLADSGY